MLEWASLAGACALCAALGAAAGFWLRGYRARSVTRGAAALLAGTVARVSVPIPAAGVGAIAYTRFGRRATLPARAAHARSLRRGALVVILSIERKVALVDELGDELEEMFR